MEAIETMAIETALDGDPAAFRELVECHSQRVFQLAYRLTGNQQDAEEVVQETFLNAHRRLSRFEARSRFSTWLHRITVNCAYDYIRKRNRHYRGRQATGPEYGAPLQQFASAGPSAERLLTSAEIQQRVASTLEQLSPNERAAFVLRHFEGLSIAEIAEQLELGVSATKHSVFRAVRKLRRALQPLMGEQP